MDIITKVIRDVVNEGVRKLQDPNQLIIDFNSLPEKEPELTGIDFLDIPDNTHDLEVDYIIHQPKSVIIPALKREYKFHRKMNNLKSLEFMRMIRIMINEIEQEGTRNYLVKYCDFYKGRGPVLSLYRQVKR